MKTAFMLAGVLALFGAAPEEPIQELRVSFSGLN